MTIETAYTATNLCYDLNELKKIQSALSKEDITFDTALSILRNININPYEQSERANKLISGIKSIVDAMVKEVTHEIEKL